MQKSKKEVLTELELDALKETMNISFGSSVADLAEILDIFITLDVPHLDILESEKLPEYLGSSVNDIQSCSIVEQSYEGDFKGVSFLVFPYGMEKELLSFFQEFPGYRYDSDRLIELEREALLEIGNILNAACIGNLFDMLGSTITYLPPMSFKGTDLEKSLKNSRIRQSDTAIILTARFSFEDRNTTGHLFFINSQDSVPFLKKALKRFQGQDA